jgi:hypothetical protein
MHDPSGLPPVDRLDSRIFKMPGPANKERYVDRPLDVEAFSNTVEAFSNAPSPGPYGTVAEAEVGAEWLKAIVSRARD